MEFAVLICSGTLQYPREGANYGRRDKSKIIQTLSYTYIGISCLQYFLTLLKIGTIC